MIHFIDPHSGEKKQDRYDETKERMDEMLRMTRFDERYGVPKAGGQLCERSNDVWGRFKRWLLVIIKRERL